MTASNVIAPPAPAEQRPRSAFGATYWILNTIEMFERLAYYGIRTVVPIYIMQATEPGGLHLTAQHKGLIYAWWAAFQSLLPIITGGYADRYGYKRVLAFSISANVVGYLMMAFMHSYLGFFAGVLVLATGTAFFKPSLQGSLAQNLNKGNSSLGWGIFYWVVNIGAFGGPFFATLLLGQPHSAEGWRNLFLASAVYTAINLLLLLTFRDVPSGASKTESVWQVLKRTLTHVWEPRLLAWLLIMSCFWLMMYQLWDLHPNFIEDWVDSSAIAAHAPFESWREYGDRGLIRVPQQLLLNLNAGLIILLVLPISYIVRRMRTLSAMLIGMTLATAGIIIAGYTGNGWVLMLGIVFFSLGEMLTGPKKSEYLGLIAPPGKKGLYLGYVNIPVGIGVFIGSWMAGELYGNFGEKATLALKELGARPALVGTAARSLDWSDSLQKLPALLAIERDAALAVAADAMQVDEPSAAQRLREHFRYDSGQILNLGLVELALRPENREAVVAGLRAATQEEPPADLSTAGLARHVHRIPGWIGKSRMQVFEMLRYYSSESGSKPPPGDAAIADLLWARYGNEPHTLNNLALEYLAQSTPRAHDAVATMTFSKPLHELPDRLGLGRTKSFAALAAAMSAGPEALDKTLGAMSLASGDRTDRLYVYLVQQPDRRFMAAARRDWARDVASLRSMIEPDPRSSAIVAAKIDSPGLLDRITTGVRSLFGSQAPTDLYERLAQRPDLIQEALAAKDWTSSPDQARRLLGINPAEAEVQALADLSEATQRATQMLWDNYHPQYYVWTPFAAIGVLATVALGIFGQMAKRWSDMDA